MQSGDCMETEGSDDLVGSWCWGTRGGAGDLLGCPLTREGTESCGVIRWAFSQQPRPWCHADSALVPPVLLGCVLLCRPSPPGPAS